MTELICRYGQIGGREAEKEGGREGRKEGGREGGREGRNGTVTLLPSEAQLLTFLVVARWRLVLRKR